MGCQGLLGPLKEGAPAGGTPHHPLQTSSASGGQAGRRFWPSSRHPKPRPTSLPEVTVSVQQKLLQDTQVIFLGCLEQRKLLDPGSR